ncbi:MAG: Hpt domain-containing protein [Deltaproteobacteria bacterium]|nr:Hpt domain-containing protein [Deltaproteobacteria bacterium]
MENEIFKEEAFELLDDIEETLLLLRADLANAEHINRIFRAVHTVKGSGAMFGFNEVADFAHKFENAIDAIRKGEATLNEECLNVFLAARDQIKIILEAENPAAPEITQESQYLIQQLIAAVSTPATTPPHTPLPVAPTPQAPAAPKSTAPAPEPPPQNTGQPTAVDLLQLPRLTALIVEDEFISRYIIQEFLSPLGTCHIAVNGFEAILAFKSALVEKRPYDLICLDIMMPGMTGTEVAREMRRLEAEMVGGDKSCRIVMTTAVSDKEVIVGMFQEKLCDAYLLKPLHKEKLYELIQNFFSAPGTQS